MTGRDKLKYQLVTSLVLHNTENFEWQIRLSWNKQYYPDAGSHIIFIT